MRFSGLNLEFRFSLRRGKFRRGKIFVGEKFRRGKISPGKNFAREKFRHLPKISSLFPDEVFPDKVMSCVFKP